MLLRKLQDPTFLKRVSHIVIDEVHERQVEVDFLLTLMKEKAPVFPELRIVLMSATMQESLFSEYFYTCPIINISGRSFPVELHYLDEINKLIGGSSSSSGSIVAGKGKGGNSKQSGRQDFRKKDAVDFAKSPVSMIRPPKFDAERIADIVIRIITRRVSNSKDFQADGAGTTAVRRIDAINQKAAIVASKQGFEALICIHIYSSSSHQSYHCVFFFQIKMPKGRYLNLGRAWGIAFWSFLAAFDRSTVC